MVYGGRSDGGFWVSDLSFTVTFNAQICCKLTDPSSVEGVGFELAVDDVVESDLLPRHPGARVIRRHQEHGEHHHHDHEPDHCRAPLTWSVAFGWSNNW